MKKFSFPPRLRHFWSSYKWKREKWPRRSHASRRIFSPYVVYVYYVRTMERYRSLAFDPLARKRSLFAKAESALRRRRDLIKDCRVFASPLVLLCCVTLAKFLSQDVTQASTARNFFPRRNMRSCGSGIEYSLTHTHTLHSDTSFRQAPTDPSVKFERRYYSI